MLGLLSHVVGWVAGVMHLAEFLLDEWGHSWVHELRASFMELIVGDELGAEVQPIRISLW